MARGIACKTCKHPAAEKINEMLLDESYSLYEISEWLEEEYPDEPVLSPTNLSRHRRDHLSEFLPAKEIKMKDGALIDGKGSIIERISVMDALNAIVTLGLRNALTAPDKVTVRDALESARIMKSIGMASGEMEEFIKEWGKTVKKPARKKAMVPKKDVIDLPFDDGEWDFSA